MVTIQDYNSYSPTWCPGCGNWAIGSAIKKALVELEYKPNQVFGVFGIGCSGNMNDFINLYAIHSLHGRSIPTAIGIRLATFESPVLVIAGDGDTYGEGGNHFIHACRGNHDITVIVHSNGVYGLTTGQVSPTSSKGYRSKSTPQGSIEIPINPLILALIQGATFVSQAFSGDTMHLSDIIKQAIKHKGFSLVNVLQPCVSFNKIATYDYYREHSFSLDDQYDVHNFDTAIKTALLPTKENRYPLGILYKEEKPSFTDNLEEITKNTLLKRERFENFDEIFSKYI